MPEPFYKPSRDTWYVELDGRQHALGRQPHGAAPPKKSAKGRWNTPPAILVVFHRLMANPPKGKSPCKPVTATASVVAGTVPHVIEKFLAWCQVNRKPRTYEFYRWRLQLFAEHIGKEMVAERIKHYHIDEFLDKYPAWSPGMKRTAARAVQRIMRWAKKKGWIDSNPVEDYEKPPQGRRTIVISPAEFEHILSLSPSISLRDLLTITWETGCRPQESLYVEARHVDVPNERWFFPADESKGEKWPRIVYLNPTALALTLRLMKVHPTGKLFRNEDGVAFMPYAVNCAMSRIQIRMGLQKMTELNVHIDPFARFDRRKYRPEEMERARKEQALTLKEHHKKLIALARQHAPKYCLYNLRHSWLDRALKSGIDAMTAAILMGHRDPSMVAKVYQHVSQSPAYLREALAKIKA